MKGYIQNMYVVKNKIQSNLLIKKLNLNRFEEQIFDNTQITEIRKFLERYPVKYYTIRDKENYGSVPNFRVQKYEVLEYCQNFTKFGIAVSTDNYDSKILTGDIFIGTDNTLWLIASDQPQASGRDAERDPVYLINSDIFDKQIRHIRGLEYLINYLYRYYLLDIVVEFAVFSEKIGINKDYVIIYELRTHY